MEYVKKSIDKRALHKRDYDSGANERQMQTTEEEVDTSKALDAILVETESSRTESGEQDTSSRSENDAHADDADIRPIYDEEPMAENAEQCYDARPLSAKLTDNQTTELSNQSLKSKNICLKKTVTQFQKDFSKLEAHCINLELQLQNNVLKSGQHGQFSKVKSNEAKVKHDIDVIEKINIKLEHKVAKLLKENKTLKKHYKELYDSIKTMRAKTVEHTTSLIAKNDEFKAQLQEKGFAITTLKMMAGDGVASIKRRRRDQSSDGVRIMAMASGRGRLKEDLESSTWRRRQSIFSLCYLFRNPFSLTTMGDANPIRTLGDYSKPSHEGYRNTIELPVGNNFVTSVNFKVSIRKQTYDIRLS
ncbi:hypothetical protein Tco_0015090 [Tanacetum coccineum]